MKKLILILVILYVVCLNSVSAISYFQIIDPYNQDGYYEIYNNNNQIQFFNQSENITLSSNNAIYTVIKTDKSYKLTDMYKFFGFIVFWIVILIIIIIRSK